MPEMPERVWLYEAQHKDVTLSGIWLAMGPPEAAPNYVQIGEPSGIPYVPESRLREVEAERELAERREAKAEVECATLRADLKALVPLARLGLGVVNGYDRPALDSLMFSLEILDLDEAESPELTTARAILDRRDREAK